MVTVNVEKELNDNVLIIGAGEAGGRIAQEFSNQGFDKVVALNTAQSDLDGLDLSEENKMLIPVTKGAGAGKDPNVIRNAVDDFYDDALRFIRSKATGVDYCIVTIGGGGGTGGGLGIVLAQIAADIGLPVGIVYTLPIMNESTLVFVNALDNLKEIHENAQEGAISPLIVVDNNKLVKKFKPTAANFWTPLNSAIVSVVRKFNEYSQKPSRFISALDKQDLKRIYSTGGVSAIGSFEIKEDDSKEVVTKKIFSNTDEEDEKIISPFFMDGFRFDTASACGVIIVGSEKSLQSSSSAEMINHVFDNISNLIDGGMFFRGVYADENVSYLKAYIFFNGLILPEDHINKMMKEVRSGYNKMKTQQNRLGDGVHVDFGEGVGGIFNSGGGSKSIHRKKGAPIKTFDDFDGGYEERRPSSSEPSRPITPRPVDNKPTQIKGVKRGGR